jgi:hypothetical protein
MELEEQINFCRDILRVGQFFKQQSKHFFFPTNIPYEDEHLLAEIKIMMIGKVEPEVNEQLIKRRR